MKARDFDPLRLDVEAFAKAGAQLEGSWPLVRLERLASSTSAQAEAGEVAWRATGECRAAPGGQPEVWLHVEAATRLMLECQRCLAPVAAHVQARRSFRFVHGEDTAAEMDVETEDDVLALTRALDLHELVEDELLLALPLVPRHGECPQPLWTGPEPQPAEDAQVHPFAALAALKRGGLPS